tara:strand:- start:39 stop:632 length:594 start_codon:yes stop_codon:yes gene_type:complete
MTTTRRIELLLTSSVENLGIVGDIVKVRMGYARNYLIPMGVAEIPSKEKIESLAEERAIALKAQEDKRDEQASTIEKLDGVVLTLTRSANDQGALYGSVTQRDIADSLAENGLSVNTRAVRLHQAIKRIGEYPVTIQFGTEMKADIEVQILPDRPLEDRDEMEFDDEGNLIIVEKPAEEVAEEPAEEVAEEPAEEKD